MNNFLTSLMVCRSRFGNFFSRNCIFPTCWHAIKETTAAAAAASFDVMSILQFDCVSLHVHLTMNYSSFHILQLVTWNNLQWLNVTKRLQIPPWSWAPPTANLSQTSVNWLMKLKANRVLIDKYWKWTLLWILLPTFSMY